MKVLARLIAASVLTVASIAAFADEAAELKKYMQAGMDSYCRLIRSKDFAGAQKVVRAGFAKDCQIVDMQGNKMGLEPWLKSMEANMKSMKSITKLSMVLENVKVKGPKGMGTEKYHMEGTVPSMSDPKKTSKLVVHGASESVYEKRDGKWLVVRTTDKMVKMTLDGKPFDPAAMAPKPKR